ncbi:MAG: hypothetical protein PF483_12485 [Halothiobacillus sp.]|jgi:hypothetical protein|nr:hypothetical protein [Halothiobacillus sp.]
MHFDINLKFQPSAAFIGVLAELNEQYSDWTDGSYDWANQTVDFLHNPIPLPKFDESLFQTNLSKRAINDLLHIAIALLSGNYLAVREYVKQAHFAFVIGFPRTGGSYLTKELLRTAGLDHTRVSEVLAHDGFPELRDTWYDWMGDRPYYHLQDAIFQTAEFLVISNLYYRNKTEKQPDGRWLAPKKFHKIVSWAGSFKMLLGQGRADYLVTIRHPVPTCVSVYEKSGGLTADGLFPANSPRSAIERWIINDLMHLGFTQQELAQMDYFDTVLASWVQFYTRMATSGLFLGDRNEVRVIPYGKESLEGVVRDFRQHTNLDTPPEPFHIHDKGRQQVSWQDRGDAAVQALTATWQTLGLHLPDLTLD